MVSLFLRLWDSRRRSGPIPPIRRLAKRSPRVGRASSPAAATVSRLAADGDAGGAVAAAALDGVGGQAGLALPVAAPAAVPAPEVEDRALGGPRPVGRRVRRDLVGGTPRLYRAVSWG